MGALSPLESFFACGTVVAISLYLYRRQIDWQLSLLLVQVVQAISEQDKPASNHHSDKPSFISKWLNTAFTFLQQHLSRLAAERDGYVATLDAINDAIIRTDKLGKIIAVNHACTHLFDCQKSELLNQDYDLCQRAIEAPEEHVDFHDILDKLNQPKPRAKLYKSIFHVDMNNHLLAIERQVTPIYQQDEFVGTVVVLRDVTKAEKLRKRLRFQANHDNVTKLFNRYKFDQRLTDAWHDAQDCQHQHALIQIDMDRFKLINDNAGHAAGDQLLRDVAKLLKTNVRTTDVCARIGGDEFSILLYHVSIEAVQQIMDNLNLAFKQLPFTFAGQVFDIGASIGATLINAESPPLAEVKRQADSACFIAKNKGINCNQQFNLLDDQLRTLQQEPTWAARIKQALEKDEFILFYQSIEPLEGNQDTKQHIEILLRLKSGKKLLSPNVFLPAVERFRLTDQVDDWVISKTFAWFEQQESLWHKQVIAINLSADSLTNPDFIEQVLQRHQSCHFPANAICFEVTETAAIDDMSMARAMIDRLRTHGFNIALDDFGKGFSTFSYLKNLPAQYIKIDGSYVEEVLYSESDHAIVKAIATMAHSMGMQTIAEFVQCEQTKELLADLGVNFVQGYGIGMPQPLTEYRHSIH